MPKQNISVPHQKWRHDLRVGTLVDSKDEEGNWFSSRIKSFSTPEGKPYTQKTLIEVHQFQSETRRPPRTQSNLKLFSPEIQQAYSWTGSPLHWAAVMDNLDMCSQLITNGSDINSVANNSVGTPLHAAAYHGKMAACLLLVRRGANVDGRDALGCTPLLLCASHLSSEYTTSACGLLLETGADVSARNKDGFTSLHIAARLGNEDLVRLLLKHGADINARDENGRTPLHASAREGDVMVSAILLSHRPDKVISTKRRRADSGGEASSSPHSVDINAQDRKGRTPLCVAMLREMRPAADLLRHYGGNTGDIDAADIYSALQRRSSSRSRKGGSCVIC